jgi:hypothetical protein
VPAASTVHSGARWIRAATQVWIKPYTNGKERNNPGGTGTPGRYAAKQPEIIKEETI